MTDRAVIIAYIRAFADWYNDEYISEVLYNLANYVDLNTIEAIKETTDWLSAPWSQEDIDRIRERAKEFEDLLAVKK